MKLIDIIKEHHGDDFPRGLLKKSFNSFLNKLQKASKKDYDKVEDIVKKHFSVNEAMVDYDFSKEELIRVIKQLKRGAGTEIGMIKAFEKALGRELTDDEIRGFKVDPSKIARVSLEERIDNILEAKKKAKEVSDNARRREWDSRKERGEVFGDMPPDFNLFDDSAFRGRDILKILQAVPRYGGVALGSYLLK